MAVQPRIAVSADAAHVAVGTWSAGVDVRRIDSGAAVLHIPPSPDTACCSDVCFVAGIPRTVALAAYYHGTGVFVLDVAAGSVQRWKRFDDAHVMSICSTGPGLVYVSSRKYGSINVSAWDFATNWMLGNWSAPMAALNVHTLSMWPAAGSSSVMLVMGARMALARDGETMYRAQTCFGSIDLSSDGAGARGVFQESVNHLPGDGLADHGPFAFGVGADGVVVGQFSSRMAFRMRSAKDVRMTALPDAAPRGLRAGSVELWTLTADGKCIACEK